METISAAFTPRPVETPPRLGTVMSVNARSALFDLYGDHLRSRGAQAPVASLVRLLAPLGITEPAARTAVSRMARQGWLAPVRCAPRVAGYALTPRAVRRLDEAAERIYRSGDPAWDGRWHILMIERIANRARRDRVRASLRYLGYAPVGETAWISPRASVELDGLLEGERLRGERFLAAYDGDPRDLLARAWDLDRLARDYRRWLAMARELITAAGPGATDEAVFALRSTLVHEWRKFLFSDPGLPAALLPAEWPGHEAATVFHAESARLLPAASRFVDSCLGETPRDEVSTPGQGRGAGGRNRRPSRHRC
jgi:phenylacetic acid degradation operon negative regulatory protein